MTETPSSTDISPRLRKIAELANQAPELAFTTLAHHIDIDLLREAFRRTRKDGAAGVDGTTAAEYATDLEGNLRSLLDRAKAGTYRAPPVRRVYIPKGDGKKLRPLGIPTFEDKVLQRAVAIVLEAVYEQDFLDFSYAYRPGRSAHQAIASMREGLMTMGGGWVLEVDIAGFFEELDHGHLRAFVRRRVRDGVLLRLIGKWLKAGVMEEGSVRRTSGEGWLHSGDIGEIENGFLKITDRKKDLIITAGGENIAPQVIEGKLKGISVVSQAVVVGDRRKHLAALLTLDETKLEELRRESGSSASSIEAAAKDDKVHKWLMDRVDEVNKGLAKVQTIKKIKILPTDLSIEGGELTPTMKVKRKVVNEKYAEAIDAFYS